MNPPAPAGPEITLKLTTKGFYVWSIVVPFNQDTPAENAAEEMKRFNQAMQDRFPLHAKPGIGRAVGFSDDEI